MRDALAEDKFGAEFNSKIDDRVQEMNAAQLQGVYNHLFSTSRGAKSDLWRNANRQIITHVEGLMRERVGVIEKAAKKLEEENMKEAAKEKIKMMQKTADANALAAVEENARIQAEAEISAAEVARKREERSVLLHKNAWLADARDNYLMKLAMVYGISNFVIIIGFSLSAVSTAVNGLSGTIIGSYFGMSSLICSWITHQKYKFSQIFPLVVTDEELEERIEKREDEIRDMVLRDLADKKRLFKEAEKQAKIERRARREAERIKAEYELETQAALMKEQADAAAEHEQELQEAKAKMTAGSTVISGSHGGSRANSPSRPTTHGQNLLDDENSICLTVDADFPTSDIVPAEELKYSEDEDTERQGLLMPTLGFHDENFADDVDKVTTSHFPVMDDGSVEISLVDVDITNLKWITAKRSKYELNVVAYCCEKLFFENKSTNVHTLASSNNEGSTDEPEIDNGADEKNHNSPSPSNYLSYFDQTKDRFWQSPVVNATDMQCTPPLVAPSKVGEASFSEISQDILFKQLKFRGSSHHDRRNAACVVHFTSDERIVVIVNVINDFTKAAQSNSAHHDFHKLNTDADDDTNADDMHRAELGIVRNAHTGIGYFEFTKADLIEAWNKQQAAESPQASAIASNEHDSEASCSCSPVKMHGVLLSDDFSKVAEASVFVIIGPSCLN